ncbi:hypothetical protein DPMN_105367 [Dreissena polymorpha]|uniref:Uncharacterized protein n=1 Tax=Dreissena polymorpha TaxID=45954 RepID=A0A9D4HBP0_DREPO|nr:hypothetical protein DPMN_105367 [Dreissena polymorpha]
MELPMSDHLAAAIRSLPGDNTGHSMIGTSPGTGPVTGPWYRSPGPVRSTVLGTGQRGPIRSSIHCTDNRGPVYQQ